MRNLALGKLGNFLNAMQLKENRAQVQLVEVETSNDCAILSRTHPENAMLWSLEVCKPLGEQETFIKSWQKIH